MYTYTVTNGIAPFVLNVLDSYELMSRKIEIVNYVYIENQENHAR